jgi:hypothetical protein
MKLRTGLKALIGISILGIAIAIFLIYTCPFAGQLAFSALVRQVPAEHGAGHQEHPQKQGDKERMRDAGMQKHGEMQGHSEAVQMQEHRDAMAKGHEKSEEGLMVDMMVIPNVRSYPIV